MAKLTYTIESRPLTTAGKLKVGDVFTFCGKLYYAVNARSIEMMFMTKPKELEDCVCAIALENGTFETFETTCDVQSVRSAKLLITL